MLILPANLLKAPKALVGNSINLSTLSVDNIRAGWENPAMWAGANKSGLLIDDTLNNKFDHEEWYW